MSVLNYNDYRAAIAKDYRDVKAAIPAKLKELQIKLEAKALETYNKQTSMYVPDLDISNNPDNKPLHTIHIEYVELANKRLEALANSKNVTVDRLKAHIPQLHHAKWNEDHWAYAESLYSNVLLDLNPNFPPSGGS